MPDRGFCSSLIHYYECNQSKIGDPAFLPATLAVMGLTAPLKLWSYYKTWPELTPIEKVGILLFLPFELLAQLLSALVGLLFLLMFVVMASLYILKAKIVGPKN